MSIGSLGMIGSVATTGGVQAKADADRVKESVDVQARKLESQTMAEDAAGIGRADGENHETHERDADGRRLYEEPPQPPKAEETETTTDAQPIPMPQAIDPTGLCGGQLDLTG